MNTKWTAISYTPVGTAFEKLKDRIHTNAQSELVSVLDAYKRVLAEDILSKENVPAYDSSHMDGFAVKAEEISSASHSNPIFLKIKPELPPANDPGRARSYPYRYNTKILRQAEVSKVLTGGYLPRGADTVIPIEEVDIICNEVKISSPLPKGAFVYPAGADVKKKEKIFSRRKVLRAQDIGVLTSLGLKQLLLFKRPKITLIPTGSELSDDFESGKKFNTNGKLIAKLIEESGGSPVDLGTTVDEVNPIRQKIAHALNISDLVLTIGGTSVGESDLVKTAIRSLGRPGIIAHGLKLDRGRVAGVAVLKGTPILALPGPIQGAINAFIVLAYPLIRLLSGRLENKSALMFYATLTKLWESRKKFRHFLKVLYVKLSYFRAGFKAEPIVGETESMLLLSKANGYILVPEKITKIMPGQTVAVHLLPGFSNINDELMPSM
jgi:molybdopterin molybdotransferase